MNLGFLLANIDDKVTDLFQAIIAAAETGEFDSESMLDLCTQLRRLGIGSVFLAAEVDDFVGYLFRSARGYLAALEIANVAPKFDPYFLCLARANPIIDCIAIRDWPGLQSIESICRREFHPEFEEQDEHCFVQFLISSALQLPNRNEHLDALEQTAAGDRSENRLAICTALESRNEAEFWGLLHSYLEIAADIELANLVDSDPSPEYAATESHFSVEGLALLQAGVRSGFSVPDIGFAMIPSACLNVDVANHNLVDTWDEVKRRLIASLNQH